MSTVWNKHADSVCCSGSIKISSQEETAVKLFPAEMASRRHRASLLGIGTICITMQCCLPRDPKEPDAQREQACSLARAGKARRHCCVGLGSRNERVP